MGRYAQFVLGPAGSGKSTYCEAMQKHFETHRRRCYIINLDPAVDSTSYEAEIDLRELIGVDDAMEELNFGPNGGLVFCMEYLTSNMSWLQVRDVQLACGVVLLLQFICLTHACLVCLCVVQERLNDFPEDDVYFLIDCPGQIELYTHLNPLNIIVEEFKSRDFNCCSVCFGDES